MDSIKKHNFQWHNYKRPTFCAHCNGLLVGMMKQGLRCKRCEVDVHDKCQEDLNKACIELIVGQHNFREKTYKQPTYCDYCKKLLVGLVNQGMRCSECGTNVHGKCQDKIEANCEKTVKSRKSSSVGFPTRGKASRTSQKVKVSPTASASDSYRLQALHEGADEPKPDPTSLFATMPAKSTSGSPGASPKMVARVTPGVSPRHSPYVSPKVSPGSSRTGSIDYGATTSRTNSEKARSSQVAQMDQMVDEVVQIMKVNADKLNERGQKIENLQDNALELEEKANLFEKKAREIKKKMWYKNYKMWIIIGVAIFLLIAIIVVAIVLSTQKKE